MRSLLSGFLFVLSLTFSHGLSAHPGHEEPDPEAAVDANAPEISGRIMEWTFQPSYHLPAKNRLGARPKVKSHADLPMSERWSSPRLLVGHMPTDRARNLLSVQQLPRKDFSVEIWATYHVNETIGAAALAYDANQNNKPFWLLGFMGGDVFFSAGETKLVDPQLELKAAIDPQDLDSGEYVRGAERYWHHLVGVKRGSKLSLYHNGKLISEVEGKSDFKYSNSTEFEITAYLDNEPHMQLGNLVRYTAVYERALTDEEIEKAFVGHRELVEHGVHERGVFHFTTGGPHLATPSTTDIHITWEADRPHSAKLQWGTTEELEHSLDVAEDGSRMKKVKVTGLDANSSYFYKVTLTDRLGESVDSGLQMFRTAVERGDPFTFAAISDTEARPHVNAKIGDLIWRETPHFMINAGDLTDGGRHDHRVEWTHEYFAAMAHLMARLPVLPVMGNGEDDFVWFERYHHTPGDKVSYYQYSYGDLDVFVLDSNLRRRDQNQPGFREEQRAWLEQSLKDSTARWKVATHHHPLLERYPEVVSDFVDLYQAHDVDLVLVGHHHNYRRSWPLTDNNTDLDDGVVYVQLGGGGGNRYSTVPGRPQTPDLRWAKTYQGYGYSLFSVANDRMYVHMHDDNGALRDTFTLIKQGSGRAKLAQ